MVLRRLRRPTGSAARDRVTLRVGFFQDARMLVSSLNQRRCNQSYHASVFTVKRFNACNNIV
jgi:hypothetical protein